MRLTIIVPAFNEEDYLAATLDSIQVAAEYLHTRSNVHIDIIVVDNKGTEHNIPTKCTYLRDSTLAFIDKSCGIMPLLSQIIGLH